MKKIISLLIILFSISMSANATEIKICLNGKIIPPLPENHQPAINDENGITYFPLRNIFEAMGAIVSWDEELQTISGGKGSINYEIQYENSTLIVNNKKTTLNNYMILNNRFLTTDDVISACFNASSNYDVESNTLNIIYDISDQDSVVIDFDFTEDYKDE